MKAAVLHAVGDLKINQVPKPALKPGERACVIRVKYAGVCGSDTARVYRDGAYSMPLVPGHEFAGVIEQAGPDSPVRAGQNVAVYPLLPCFTCQSCKNAQYPQCEKYDYFGSRCDGGFSEYVKAPYFNLVSVPDGVPLELAALCEPASVAQHAARTVGITGGDSVLIFGAGAIGLVLAQWARIMGASAVTLVDISEDKIRAGRTICPDLEFINSSVEPLENAIGVKKFSLTVEGTGAPSCYGPAIDYAENNGAALLLGNPSRDVVLERATVSKILRKQLGIRGTWNSTVGGPINEWKVTLDAIASGDLKLDGLITHRYRLDDVGAALEMMHDNREFFNRVMIEC